MLPVQWKASLLPLKHACDQITHTLAHTHAHSDCALVHAYYSYIYRSLMSRHARTLTAKAPHMQTHCSAPLSLSVTECVCVSPEKRKALNRLYIILCALTHTHRHTLIHTKQSTAWSGVCHTAPSIDYRHLFMSFLISASLSLSVSLTRSACLIYAIPSYTYTLQALGHVACFA